MNGCVRNEMQNFFMVLIRLAEKSVGFKTSPYLYQIAMAAP